MAWVKADHIFPCALIFIVGICVSQAKDGYLLTVPRILRHGTSFEYCLTMYGNGAAEKQAVLNFINPETGKIVAKDDNLYVIGQQTCREFPVPAAGDYELLLSNATDILHDAVKVTVLPKNILTLVQTDKPMYKPGQTVKFRIMTLLSDMKARTGQIKSIYISDPNDFRVKQYLNVDTQGIASLDFQLGSEAKLGKWKIEVNVECEKEKKDRISAGSFIVKEYVLPRFEVEIEPPPFILATDETISGKVCGKYTYGKPVSGFLHLDVCWKTWHSPITGPCHSEVVRIDGCFNFTVNSRDIKYNDYYISELQIRAKITEDGTGVTVSKNHTGPEETRTPLTIELDDYTNSFFKPGLPYYGKVTVAQPDGQPATGEVITVEAKDHSMSLRFFRNFTTDAAGQIVFALCGGFTADTTNIYISASALRFANSKDTRPVYGPMRPAVMYEPTASRQVRQWFSPSLSYVQLPRPESPATYGQRLTLNVPYTTRQNTETTFQFQVMARGKVVKTGVVTHQEGDSAAQGMLQPPAQLCLQREINLSEPSSTGQADGPSIAEEKIPIAITHDGYREPIVRSEQVSDTVASFLLDIPIESIMSPEFTLLVYHVMPDGEIVADSMDFDVEPHFENQVTLEFNETTALPGQKVDLKLGAAPGSVCGVGVVDKSVNILGGDHQITPAQVFKKISELSNVPYGLNSATYGDEYEYCEERIKNVEAQNPEVEEDFWHYSSSYVDALEAFKLSNMMVLTNLQLETRPCSRSVPVVYGKPKTSFIGMCII
ncbi:alpha-2-macroglobulin-like protein [Elysia marginata]|uniref:Alpha-2-macroglobulin-like protein n=1 Tax=Elysia marginata TaxID=1093978 RepID=A0AAV4IGT8_9GAST|nr:alpha-2-macroglobulin-like protein [Elysia marginata]